MNKNQLNTALAAILTTALETEPAPFPESFGYLAVGSDIQKWTEISALLEMGELAAIEGHQIKLTEKGRAIARKCNEFAGVK